MLPSDVSPWLLRWSALLPSSGTALDLAAGGGRHARWLAGLGLRVTAVDRDAAAMGALAGVPGVFPEVADLESPEWPLLGRRFDVIVVTNYLWRPHLPDLIANLGEGGFLLYETFARGQERLGRPTNPAFLLEPGELIAAVQPGLAVVAFEEGVAHGPARGGGPAAHAPRMVQRIVATRRTAGDSPRPALP